MYLLTSVTWLYHGLKCTTHWGNVFFKVISWPVVGFNWPQSWVHNEKAIIIINYLLTSYLQSLQGNLRPRPWWIDLNIAQSIHQVKASVWDFPLMTSLSVNKYYYSFKTFPRFWLAKSKRLIHHNQLLMTKFGRNLTLTRKWRQKCSVRAG